MNDKKTTFSVTLIESLLACYCQVLLYYFYFDFFFLLTADYVATLTAISPCSSLYNNPTSFLYTQMSTFVRSAMQSIFSVLPGDQLYMVNSIR